MKIRGVSLLFLLTLFTFIGRAQAQESVIKGSVTDSAGALVQSAFVAIRGEGSPFRLDTATDAQGLFEAHLPPGRYSIQASSRGFAVKNLTGVIVEPNSVLEVKITLEVTVSEKVIVSARRYEEELDNVPISMAVFDSDSLRTKQINRLEDITLHSPNVNFFRGRGSSDNAAIFIRGIGQEDNVFTADAGVGLYFDGVLLPLAQGGLLDMLDVERLEILRGPQGTLYGRNTIAGAIKYETKRPTDEPSGEVEAAFGNYWRRDFKGTFSFPIIREKLLMRLTGASLNRSGFELNTFTGERLDSKKSLLGRGSILFKPKQGLDVGFRFDGLRERPSVHIGIPLRPITTALDFPGALVGNLITFSVPPNPFRVRTNIQNRDAVDTWGLGSTIESHLTSSMTLRFIASYRKLDADLRTDLDATEARAADVFTVVHHNQASGELQLMHTSERWNTVGGVFFFYDIDHQFDGTDGTAKGFSTDATYQQRIRSAASYVQTNGRLSEKLSATLGIRFTYETKEFGRQAEQHTATNTPPDYNLFGGFGNGPGAVPPSRFPGNGRRLTDIPGVTGSWSAVTPRFGGQYQFAPNVMTFASIARGFKSGGFNGRASLVSSPHANEPYKPEYVWTYEAGGRTAWFDQRLTAWLTYFYNQYTDLQLQTFVKPSNGSVYESLLSNAGEAATQGFELELRARPVPKLYFYSFTGFTNAKFVKFLERDVDISRHRSLPNVPRWTSTAGGSYVIARPSEFSVEVGGDINYQGGRFLTVSNLRDLHQGGYTVINSFVALEPDSRNWLIQFGIKNLTNKRYMTAGLDLSAPPFGAVIGYFGDPRTLTLSICRRFGERK